MLPQLVSLTVVAWFARVPAIAFHRSPLMLAAVVTLAALPVCGAAQSLAASGTSPAFDTRTTTSQSYLIYAQPTRKTKLHNYLFDAFGPYPIAVASVYGGH